MGQPVDRQCWAAGKFASATQPARRTYFRRGFPFRRWGLSFLSPVAPFPGPPRPRPYPVCRSVKTRPRPPPSPRACRTTSRVARAPPASSATNRRGSSPVFGVVFVLLGLSASGFRFKRAPRPPEPVSLSVLSGRPWAVRDAPVFLRRFFRCFPARPVALGPRRSAFSHPQHRTGFGEAPRSRGWPGSAFRLRLSRRASVRFSSDRILGISPRTITGLLGGPRTLLGVYSDRAPRAAVSPPDRTPALARLRWPRLSAG